MRRLGFALLPLAAPALAQAPAWDDIDLEFVPLADATGSIDADEIMLQGRGYAEAMTVRLVISAITGGARGKIAVAHVEWADASSQYVVVNR